MNRFTLAVAASLLASTALADTSGGVTEEMLLNDTASTGDVLTNGMGRHLQRHSPLETLNKATLSPLGANADQ